MKLRIRSMATKETIRVSTPDTSSLDDLKMLICNTLASSSSTPNPIAPDSMHLSLNQTDELVALNPRDTLSTLGLASGDLLFFSSSPIPQTLVNRKQHLAPNSTPPVSNSSTSSSSSNVIGKPSKENAVNPHPISTSTIPMVVDAVADQVVLKESDNTHLIPQFLVDLMNTETGEDASILARVVMFIHAALLDSGFTLLNGSGPNLPHGWALQVSSLRLLYTIPNFLDQVQGINEKVAVLKFSVLGSLVIVYGYLGGAKPDFYRFSCDLTKVATLFSLDLNSLSKSEQGELMGIFRAIKDAISLPLKIDLCLKNGLPLPPCFMLLSVDVKSKIMDLLPGADAVRLGSTCKEMRNLSLDDNLWREKVEREFSSRLNDNTVMSASMWRERYKRAYIAKKRTLNFSTRPNTTDLFFPALQDYRVRGPFRYY